MEYTRPEDKRLPAHTTLIYALQHMFVMYAGMVTPGLIIGHAAGLTETEIGVLITACAFLSGVATLVQTLGVPFRHPIMGSQLPIIQGSSIALVGTVISIATASHGGLPVAFGALIAACVIGVIASTFWKYVETLLPPVVTGCAIAIIGLALFRVAFLWSMGGQPNAADYGSLLNLSLAAITTLTIIVLTRIEISILTRLSLFLSIIFGTIVAYFMGLTDFPSALEGAVIEIPTLFPFGVPEFQLTAILKMVIIVLVMMVEATAVFKALGGIIGTEVDGDRIGRGLKSDMLFGALAPVIGALPCSTFAQNAGVVAVSRVYSRYVVATAGIILVAIGIFPVIGRLVAEIPLPVLGGAGIVLFGSIVVHGLRILSEVDYSNDGNMIIVAVSLGLGLMPSVMPALVEALPSILSVLFDSGIAVATLSALLLNLVFNGLRASSPTK